MSREGLASLTRSVAEVRQVIVTLMDDEWSRESGCSGWSVKDLVAHMSSNYKEVVEPSPAPTAPINLPAERMMDMLVEPRKKWTNEEVRDEYLEYCDGALAGLAALQDEPFASTMIPLADLGNYPMNLLADAFAFDHYCHTRIDLLAPHGPITRDLPPADDALLGPAVGWMLTGIPQMQPGLERHLNGRIRLELTGVGAGAWDLVRSDTMIVIQVPAGEAAATVTSDAHEFVRWGTARIGWRAACVIAGDQSVAEEFLDHLNII
jgi:uncharacterized protein (TIGR03083 family)